MCQATIHPNMVLISLTIERKGYAMDTWMEGPMGKRAHNTSFICIYAKTDKNDLNPELSENSGTHNWYASCFFCDSEKKHLAYEKDEGISRTFEEWIHKTSSICSQVGKMYFGKN